MVHLKKDVNQRQEDKKGRPGITPTGLGAAADVGESLSPRASSSMRDRRILQSRAQREKEKLAIKGQKDVIKKLTLRETIARKRSEDVLSKSKVADRIDEAFNTKLDRRSDLFKTDRARRAAEISFELDESLNYYRTCHFK